MPIYDITGVKNTREEIPSFSEEKIDISSLRSPQMTKEKSSLVSSILSRLFFAALLALDFGWAIYALVLLTCGTLGRVVTLSRIECFSRWQNKGWIALKRSLVCALALVAAICSPAFGIMIACTYFLMYDRNGIEEIIPGSLQDQFRDFFK